MEEYLEAIRPYYNAFKQHNMVMPTRSRLTQKVLAQDCGIRQADLTAIFQYLDDPTPNRKRPRTNVLFKFFTKLSQKWRINEESGLLEKIGKDDPLDDTGQVMGGLPITIHENYTAANVASAAKEPGNEVWVINTYLASMLQGGEAAVDDENTLENWLVKQNKKVKLLLLRTDGKAMRLRTQTNLKKSGQDLANAIISSMRSLLQLQKEVGPEKLEIRLMDEIPGLAAVIFDQRLFYGIHWANGHTEGGPTFEISNPKHFAFVRIKQHFSAIWDNEQRSEPLTQELLGRIEHALTVVRAGLKYLQGTWNVQLHNLESVYSGSGPAPAMEVTGKVSCFTMEITKPEHSIYLNATLHLPNRERPITANLITERLGDRDYAHVRFSDFNRLSIHLSFQCKQDNYPDPLLGFFTMASGSDNCAGSIVLQKVANSSPVSEGEQAIPSTISRILAFQDGSYLSAERIRKEMDAFEGGFPFQGTYKVYSYGGRQGAGKCIKVNWLQINAFGEALYTNQHYKPITGRATRIEPNLHIVFTTFTPQKRRNYLIISVKNALPEKGRFYSGVHLGVSWVDHMPNGKRVVLEYVPGSLDFKKLSAEIIPLHSERYKKLPESLRRLLSGRVKNLLGFLRTKGNIFTLKELDDEWEGSIHLSEVFYDSAIRQFLENDPDNTIEMLFRAVNHGFNDLERFEKDAYALDPNRLAVIQKSGDYLKIKRIIAGAEENTVDGMDKITP